MKHPKFMTSRDYAMAISAALRREWGHLRSMRREICEQTGASEATAKNWLAGTNGPGGEHLLKLMAVSDEVYDTAMGLAGIENEATAARRRIRQAMAALRGEDKP